MTARVMEFTGCALSWLAAGHRSVVRQSISHDYPRTGWLHDGESS